MKNFSIKKALVLVIAVILVSIVFIPVINAQFGIIFSKFSGDENSKISEIKNSLQRFVNKFSKNPNDDKVVKPANPLSSPPLGDCNLIIRLPANPVTMVVDKTASNSYFDTTLSNVPSGYDVSNGDYLGWCIDLDHSIANNTSYQVYLYSSYNTSMPSYLWHNNLSKVNYILNNKQGSWQQVQNAIWYLLDFGDSGLNSYGWAMVNDAIAYGSSFCPGVGDVIAIITDAGTNVQYTVIELEVPVYTLTVNIDGSGSVNPSGGTYASGTAVELTAVPDSCWSFSHWSGDLTGSNNPETITMDSDKTVTAHFVEKEFTLTVITDGNGIVTKDPDQTIYSCGTDVELTAVPDSCWSFSHWSGDLTGSNNPETITMDSDKTVTAHFVEKEFTLTVITDGNGIVTKDPDETTYSCGTDVELTAVPDSCWVFDHWSGDLTGSNNPETITMDSDKTVTAHFVEKEFTLTVITDGNGIVTKDPDETTYSCGTDVELTAVPDSCWVFDHWSGDLTGSNNPETITMDSDKTVTAHFVEKEFTLTVITDGNGIVTKDPDETTYSCGTDVELTAVPDSCWVFDHWSGDLTGSNNPETITMDSDKTVTAHFVEGEFTLTVITDGNGIVTKDPDETIYSCGTDVELTAVPDSCWVFDHWSGDLTGSNNPETITMDSDKTVTAHFVEKEFTLTVITDGNGIVTKDPDQTIYSCGTDVELTAVPDSCWVFDHWSGDLTGSNNPETITMDSDKTVTAHFVEKEFTLTVITDGNGIVTKDPDQTIYSCGTDVELTAVPDSCWVFDHWSGDLTGSNNPETITMDSDKTVTAHFVEGEFTLTVIIDGCGFVTKDPDQTIYSCGTDVELTASSCVDWFFSGWSGDLTGSNNPETIVMDSDKTVTAHFTSAQEYTLTINIDGICGWVIKDPDWPTYPHGTVVELTAETIDGWAFTHWSGDLSGSNNPEYITMDSHKTVTAHFIVVYYELNINILGNGAVNKVPDEPLYHYGANVTLTAIPDAGWTFDHWSGDLSGSDNPTYIKIKGDTTVTAHFTTGEFTLDINIDGDGYVIKDPNQATHPYGEIVELTAVSNPGWIFDHWSGDLTGSNNPETILIDDNKIVTAHFSIAEPPESPGIDGPTNGKAGTSYPYTFITTDPYESDIYYYIEWGDSDFEDWIGPYSSGEEVTISHTWDEEDIYTIQAKTRNIYGAESDWATLEVEMPVNQQITAYPLFQRILERFPNAFPILRTLLGL